VANGHGIDLDTKRLQGTCAVGPDHESGTDLTKVRRALEDLNVKSGLPQGDASRQSGDSRA
jgi:hypothetical protein